MTATATATNQIVADWVKVFPRQVTECYTSSVTFMKQLTVVAISTISYMKNALPIDSYIVETFGGTKIRILKKKCRDDIAQFLSTAMTQAFDAFDKKYLHQLALCFYEDECKSENLIEYHIFEYSYKDDGVTMNVVSKNRNNTIHSMEYSFENIREKTITLIKALFVLMQTNPNELPSSYDVSLRLYYNDDAPADYQAPGYQHAGDDHLPNPLKKSVKLGWVETPFHKFSARCYVKDLIRSSHEAIPSQNVPILSNTIDLSGPYSDSVSENDNRVVCPCNRNDFEENGMLTCKYCNTQQHAVCFGILRVAPETLVSHCCTACFDVDQTRIPIDSMIADAKGRKRECISMFRRTLHFCTQTSFLCVNDFVQKFSMTESNAYKMINILYSQGILKINPALDPTPQKVIIEKVREMQVSYFDIKQDDIVNRLLAETFSQDSLTDVLSPLERVNLNFNTGNTDRRNLNLSTGNTDRRNLNLSTGNTDRNSKERSDNLTDSDTDSNARALKERLDNLRDGNTDSLTDDDYLTLQEYRDALPPDNISEPNLAQTINRPVKRKINYDNNKPLKLGVRTKRVRALDD